MSEPLIEPLDAEIVSRLAGLMADDVHLLNEIDSTNQWLADRMHLPHGSVCIADSQTHGRGTRGRQWLAPPGRNLTMSMRLRTKSSLTRLQGLSLALGVAVVSALVRLGVADVQLKWPNDLIARGAKLGGILVDARGGPGGSTATVGIGLNVYWAPENLIDQPSICLADFNSQPPSRNQLAGTIGSEILTLWPTFLHEGIGCIQARWNNADAFNGRAISVESDNGRVIAGRAGGIDASGRLMVHGKDGKIARLPGNADERIQWQSG